MPRTPQFDKAEILRTIRNWMVHSGVAPTVEELRQALGAGSTRTVLRYLQQLEEDGSLRRWPGARGMKLLRAADGESKTRPVPLVGAVPAGSPILAEENLEGWVRLPESFLSHSSEFFLLRVLGDSMNKAQVAGGRIEDGDLVLVCRQSSANPGDIVVVLIDGEATVKRLVRGPDYFVLLPVSTNRTHQSIIIDRDTSILGVVVRVFKQGSTLLDEA